MWGLINQTRFKAERTFARDADGAEIWIVGVRATFSIQPDGEVVSSDEPQEVCLAPKFFGEPAHSSLQYDLDLVRTKPGTDVVLQANAHAPSGYPADFVDVSATVGPLSKKLRVFGNRFWERGWNDLEPGPPQPFISLPIRYERAWGGLLPNSGVRDRFNPAGIGTNARPGEAVPNIESPANPIRSSRHSGPPAGFGPIAFHWQPRLGLAGTYDDIWRRDRQPLVPTDFQNSYFRCAPGDQQIEGFLQGGEEVVLRNLTSEGLLRFRLPRVSLGFNTRFAGGTRNHRGQLYTVIIEPEERRLIMVWQTALPCHHTLYTLKQTVVFEKERLSPGTQISPEAELVV